MSARNVVTTMAGVLKLRIVLRCALLVVAGLFGCALAEVSQTPLFLKEWVKPNIMFTLDDSGSMSCEFLMNKAFNFEPDCPGGPTFSKEDQGDEDDDDLAQVKFRSPDVNRLFYDPAMQYVPWQKADGSYYANHTPSNKLKSKAYFYRYKGNDTEEIANYTKVTIKSGNTYSKSKDRTDCAGESCTYDEEIQNFANWYKYYRKRLHTAIAGASRAFNGLDGNYRVGYGQINSASTTVDDVATNTVMLGVRDFTKGSQAREDWFAKLFAATSSGHTPLRRAMDDVGQYFSRSDDKGPWAEFPGVSRGTEFTCRRNFHILMTDGYWTNQTGDAAYTSGASNADDNAGAPYSSSAMNTLADVAYYYWKNDLRADLADNDVKDFATSSDPAVWQHLVQYTIGLGVDGTLDPDADLERLKSGSLSWPVPDAAVQNDPKKTDDLWHAALNGHGMFFDAKSAADFVAALAAALGDIKKGAAAASIAVGFNRVEEGGKAYVPSFESGTWLGHLKAYEVNQSDGSLGSTAAWDAAKELPAWSERNIVTWNGSEGVNFVWANLTDDQKALLGSEDVLKYLKGDDAKEKSKADGKYRDRTTKLGDIVNSSPLLVKASHRWYQVIPDQTAAKGYKDFFEGKRSRTAMVYAGANDGMLHGFDAETGVERFAFIPGAVYPNLKSLSDPNYAHKYFVDGKLTEGDAFLSGSWKNVLMGSAGAGAKSVFAIDVTNPGSMSASSVMWEKTDGSEDAKNQDMGYVMGQLELELMADGSWAVIHGNGYDSANKKAVLYVRNARTGSIIRKIDTAVGSADAPNGLSAPTFVRDDQRRVITAYAGDLQGNLWKFDLSNPDDTSKWSASVLFTAKRNGKAQPITQRPAISTHPDGGYVITFGTGKYVEAADSDNKDVQSIYGVWDKPGAAGVTYTSTSETDGRPTVLQEQILTGVTGGAATLTQNEVDWTSKRGWLIDLNLTAGERVIADSRIIGDILWLTSFAPGGSDPCKSSGSSRIYGVSYLTGQAITRTFDTNRDGKVDSNDDARSGIETNATVSGSTIAGSGGGVTIYGNGANGQPGTTVGANGGDIYRIWNMPPEVY